MVPQKKLDCLIHNVNISNISVLFEDQLVRQVCLDIWYKLSIYVALPEIRHVEYLESITYQFLLFDPTHPATLNLHKGRQPMGQFLFLMAILDDILQCGPWYKQLTILATKHKHLDGFLHILRTCLKYEWIWCSHWFFFNQLSVC